MDDSNALVIILGIALAILLVMAIVFMIKLIQIVNHIKHLMERAEKVADSAQAVGSFFKKTAGPVTASKVVANIIEAIRSNDKKHK